MRIRTGPCGRWEFGAHKWKLGLKYYTNSSEWQCGSHRGNSREQRPHTPAVTGVWRVTGVAECSQLIMKQKQSACRLKLEAELERQCAPNAHSQRRGRVRSTADFRGRNMRDIWLAGRIHNNTIITAWDACTGAGGGGGLGCEWEDVRRWESLEKADLHRTTTIQGSYVHNDDFALCFTSWLRSCSCRST